MTKASPHIYFATCLLNDLNSDFLTEVLIVGLLSMSDSATTSLGGLSRPQTFHGSKSFTRMEPSPTSPLARSRAKTLQDGSRSAAINPRNAISSSDEVSTVQHGDIYENESAGALDASSTVGTVVEDAQELPNGFNDLPIELLSLTDR